ncbi:ADP-ribosylglycohydrolase family protein [Desulfobaculum bizertense]|uniref:ADP-ribosylglycohydrolase n=1 Tax=Desulfobaculum bizertense DSM 18034 TaxID=1121442 RepID=A0A1T4VJE4_9BACT|nr:ADP-ribosylglycohydrolase family protein [Desulfobaculum bizertense]UIJ37973.1 ADP-ribosylglycohydrolase family protein [Desulfobaculum bizertense]UIJ38002.1 ADP-ribosylglycohydrolase family protein [Desulfobaculum bizertense]SKA65046.1 ADP-ribosylglycohydrolase [Desulfobaculum bizertense DSM 18034]
MSTSLSPQERAAGALLGMFAGDALALGPHWIYSTDEIHKKLSNPEQYSAPIQSQYHKDKGAGDQTHYGDQALVLLESVSAAHGFELENFFEDWQKLFEKYSGYRDKATKETLNNIASGSGPESSGSNSADISAASRLGALIPALYGDFDALEEAAVAQARMTHNTPVVLDATRFFVRVLRDIFDGKSMPEAIALACAADYEQANMEQSLEESRFMLNLTSVEAVPKLGQGCTMNAAFRSSLHLLLRHPENIKDALVENVLCGGDSAARGMLLGTVLGAVYGPAAIPENWLAELTAKDRISTALQAFS